MVHRLRIAPLATAALAASVVALAGCTTETPAGGATSAAQSTTGPSSTTTTSGLPTGTTTSPTSATSGSTSTTATDDQLAIEAVQRYYAAFNEALVTLKTTEMRKLFQPGCVICEKDVAEIDKMARNGERVIGGATTLSNFVVTLRSGQHLSLRASGYSEAMLIKDATGKVIVDEQAVSGIKRFTLLHREGSWIVAGIS